MASKVEQEILVKIKTIIEGLEEVKKYSDSVKNLGKSGGAKSLTSDFLKAGAAAGAVSSAVTKILDVVGQLVTVGARGLAGFVAEGIEFNKIIESSRIGIATLVANTYEVRDASGELLGPMEAFNASLEKAEDLERGLQKSAIETKFEFQEVLSFFNSSVLGSAGLKTNLDAILNLTQGFALAAGAANINVEKVNTGIKQILTGATTVRNDLARVLFPGLSTRQINDQLKAQREAGTLVDFLDGKLKVFKLSADTVAQSFEAVASNASDALKVFEAAATLPLFDKIKETLGFIINQIVDLSGEQVKLTPGFQKIADILARISALIGDALLAVVRELFEWIGDIADFLIANQEDIERILINVYAIAEQVALIAVDLFSVVGAVGRANSDTKGWLTATQSVALFLGFIRDVLNIIVGTYLALAGASMRGLAISIQVIADLALAIGNYIGSWIPGLQTATAWAGRFAQALNLAGTSLQNSGTDQLISGLNSDALNSAVNRLNSPFPTLPSGQRRTSGFSFNARRAPSADAAGAAGAKKRAEDQRLRDARRLFDEIEKYAIATARREADLFKQTNRIILDEIELRYERGLIAAESFYRQKQQLALADLEQEKATLKKEQQAADAALARDLGAIEGKFALKAEELNAIFDKLDPLLEGGGITSTTDAKTIKQAQEYIKYLNQTAEIDQKLKKIENERKQVISATTAETEKATRANKTLFDSLASEFAESQGKDGFTELFNLQKRVSDELPKILSETNSTLPRVEELASALQKAGAVDISGVPKVLSEFGIKFEDLSEEARLFLKLLERLQALARIKSIASSVSNAQSTFNTATRNAQDDFSTGRISVEQAINQISSARHPLVQALTTAYREQLDALIQLQAAGLATEQDAQAVEALRRAIDGVTAAIDAQRLAIINLKSQRDQDRLAAQEEAVLQGQRAGTISTVEARKQILAIQRQQIAALNEELSRLLLLDQTLPEVAQRVADVQNQIAGLTNDIDQEFTDFATGINSQIGGAFSGFLETIIQGTESIGDAFRQMLSQLLLGIANAIAQAILLKYILQPLGLAGGPDASSGGFGGFLGGFLKKADGGILSGPGTGTSDSIPALLSHGEGVIPAARVRQYGADMIRSIINGTFMPRLSFTPFASGGIAGSVGGSGGRGRGVRILNSVDPNLVRDYMQSAEGEELILNVIGKNPGLVQRLV